MILRTALAEISVSNLREVIPEATFSPGNWYDECASRPMTLDVNLWYELRSESPGVIYLPLRGAEQVSTDRRSEQFASV